MDEIESLAHAKWECEYHVVWIPKYRRKALYGEMRKPLGPAQRELTRQRECVVERATSNSTCPHAAVHSPKYAVAQIVGYIKGNSAIPIARSDLGRRQNFTGEHFWACGYYLSTVGRDEAAIREYIRGQGVEDQGLDQLPVCERVAPPQVGPGVPTALRGSRLSSHRLCRWGVP